MEFEFHNCNIQVIPEQLYFKTGEFWIILNQSVFVGFRVDCYNLIEDEEDIL